MRHRVDSLVLIGGFITLIDTVWGGLASLGLDSNRTNQLVMAISLILGFPVYLFDLWMDKRIAISMIGLFFFRWIARCFAGSAPVLCNPWRGSVLLIFAIVLLQVSKLRREQRLRPTSPPA
jgi:hypothetical protein